MLKEIWRDLVGNGALPCREDVWEISRLGVDPDLPGDARRRVLGELLCAGAEFGFAKDFREFLFVTSPALIAIVARNSGLAVDVLGAPRPLAHFKVAAARLTVTEEALEKTRRAFGIVGGVLRFPEPCEALAA